MGSHLIGRAWLCTGTDQAREVMIHVSVTPGEVVSIDLVLRDLGNVPKGAAFQVAQDRRRIYQGRIALGRAALRLNLPVNGNAASKEEA